MMAKIKTLFQKAKQGGVRSSTAVIALFMLLSQVLGLVRDRLFASQIGPGLILDSYYAAFKVPDVMLALAGTLVSVTILLPFIIKLFDEDQLDSRLRGNDDSVSNLVGMIIKVVGVGYIIVAVLLHIFMPQLMKLLYPGFSPEALDLTVTLARIMMFSPLFFMLANLFANITQYTKKFVLYALTPVIYNGGIVFGIIALYPTMGARGLALGVLVGAFLQILLHIPALLEKKVLPNIFVAIDWNKIKEITLVAIPRTIGIISTNVNTLIISSFASFAGTGGLSRLSMALVISNTPLALVSTSYATAVFPDLVSSVQKKDTEATNKLLLRAIGDVSMLIFLIVGIGLVLRTYGIRILLGGGAFSWTDTKLVSASLFIFLLTLPAQALDTIALRLYYAKGEAWRPMWRNIGVVITTLVLTFFAKQVFIVHPYIFDFLYKLFNIQMNQANPNEILIVVIAAAYLVSSLVAFVLLWTPLVREYLRESFWQLVIKIGKSVYVAFLAGSFSWIALYFLAGHIETTTLIKTALVGIPAGIVGLVGAGIGFILLKYHNKN